MDAVLEKAKERLEEDGGTLTVPILKALIKSKGSDSPDKRKKAISSATPNQGLAITN